MISIEEFCTKNGACNTGKEWAIANCKTMLDVWREAKGEWLVWVATQPGVATARERRLLAVYAARSIAHLLDDRRSLAAIDCAERYANGTATDEELAAAEVVATEAERASLGDAAWAASRVAMQVVAVPAALDAAWDAVGDAVWATAKAATQAVTQADSQIDLQDVAQAAVCNAAWSAAWDDFAAWCRENIVPNFE